MPPEIMLSICDFIGDPETIVNLGSTCKEMKNFVRHKDIIWKRLLDSWFYKIPEKKRSNKPCSPKKINDIVSYEEKFIKFVKSFCINCNKKSTKYNPILKRLVCQNCERNFPEYTLVSATVASKDYYLSKEQLSRLKYISKRNYYNGKQNVRLYMLKDVKNMRDSIFSPDQLEIIKADSIRKKITKNIQIFHRFSMVNSILHFRYSVSNLSLINVILPSIDSYSFGDYSKFLRSGRSCDFIIEMCLELDFIGKTYPGRFIYNNYFDSFLLEMLLFNPSKIPIIVNEYIEKKIKDCVSVNRDIFYRRNLLVKYFKIKECSEKVSISEISGSCDLVKRWIYHGERYCSIFKAIRGHSRNNINSTVSGMTEYVFCKKEIMEENDSVISRLYKLYKMEKYVKTFHFNDFFNAVAITGNSGRRNGSTNVLAYETNADICMSIVVKNASSVMVNSPTLFNEFINI